MYPANALLMIYCRNSWRNDLLQKWVFNDFPSKIHTKLFCNKTELKTVVIEIHLKLFCYGFKNKEKVGQLIWN